MAADPIPAALGRPIAGPSAVGGDWRRVVHLTRTLAVTDFKLKFFGSVLGYLWQLMKPLLLFGVLYAVFTRVLKFGEGVAFYPAILLMNIVLFTFFSESSSGAVTSLVDRESLVRKIQFPRLVIPLATVASAGLNLVLNFAAVIVFMAIQGVSLHVSQLELPLIVLALALFSAGVSALLSAAYVRARDVKPIWDVALQMLYFATPIIYPFEQVVGRYNFRHIVYSNPLAVILQQARHALVDPKAPTAVEAVGGWGWMAIPIAIFAGAIVVGFWTFARMAPNVAEDL